MAMKAKGYNLEKLITLITGNGLSFFEARKLPNIGFIKDRLLKSNVKIGIKINFKNI